LQEILVFGNKLNLDFSCV